MRTQDRFLRTQSGAGRSQETVLQTRKMSGGLSIIKKSQIELKEVKSSSAGLTVQKMPKDSIERAHNSVKWTHDSVRVRFMIQSKGLSIASKGLRLQ